MHEYDGDPDYKGSRDEIVRYDIEAKFTRQISLKEHCGYVPKVYFQSVHEWFVRCSKCGIQSKICRCQYKAMQAWNREEYASYDL